MNGSNFAIGLEKSSDGEALALKVENRRDKIAKDTA